MHHEMGTARMGRDPKTSVLNGWNQSHDVPNLFVTDGACMTSLGQSESIDHVHGAHRQGVCLRGRAAEAAGPVVPDRVSRRRFPAGFHNLEAALSAAAGAYSQGR